MRLLSRPIATVLIALMVWLPSALAWASCCAVAMDSETSAGHAMTEMQQAASTPPCHGDIAYATTASHDVSNDRGSTPSHHADGSACEHGAGCTLATAVIPQFGPAIALSAPASGLLDWVVTQAPDAPVIPIDHPPSLI